MAHSPVAVLNVGQNGQVTIPAGFRRQHKLSKGAKVMAVEVGGSLVMVPHDPILDALTVKVRAAMKAAGVTVEDLKAEALRQRAKIVRERYGPDFGKARRRARR